MGIPSIVLSSLIRSGYRFYIGLLEEHYGDYRGPVRNTTVS